MKCGFTLIELSIVLVIIGLIAGGVLVGRTMIRQAQLRTISADVEKFQTAINTFRLKYNCQPGDCANATTFWGTNPNCATGGLGTGTQTCNGNGNKWTNIQFPPAQMEQYSFWQHLSNAQLIAGTYSGQSSTYSDCEMSVSCPGGKVSNRQVYYYAAYLQPSGSADWWPHPQQHFMIIGSRTTWAGYPGDPLITAQEAFSIDSKMDDGRPGLGKWRMFGRAYNPNCAIDGTDGTLIVHASNQQQVAEYNTSNSGITCAFRVFTQ